MKYLQEVGDICHKTLIEELPNSTNLPHMHTALPPHTTTKKITRPDTSIPGKRWNMPIRLSSGRKKLIKNP
ncbi:MAG TPA: hypothetical protein VNE63_07480 [Candidatus Acidoferrales bacterium]|nr:hypothetical protein [Candidatus Acidoferrales bacterium]